MNEKIWSLADDWYSAVAVMTSSDPILMRVLELTKLSPSTLLSVAEIDARTANVNGAIQLEPREVAQLLGVQARDVARCRAVLADAGFLRAPRHLSTQVVAVRTLRVPPEVARIANQAPPATPVHRFHVA